jgi:hypothetical protein
MTRIKPFVCVNRVQNLLVFWKFKYLALNHGGKCAAQYGPGIFAQVVQPAPYGSGTDTFQAANGGADFSRSTGRCQSAVNKKMAIHR